MNAANEPSEPSSKLPGQWALDALDLWPATVLMLDSRGVVTFVNEAWRTFGRANGASRDLVAGVGQDYLLVCPPEVATTFRAVLEGQLAEASFGYSCHAPFELRWFDCRVKRTDGGVLVAHIDCTAAHALSSRSKMQDLVASALACGRDPLKACSDLMREACVSFDWDVGAVWRPEPDGRLQQYALYTNHDCWRWRELVSANLTFVPGEGAIGRAWAQKEPLWLHDLPEVPGFKRAAAAREVGLRGGLFVPLVIEGEVLAVVELLSRHERPRDDTLAQLLHGAGILLLASTQARRLAELERDRARALERYRALFVGSREALVTIDPQRVCITGANPAALRLFGQTDEASVIGIKPWELLDDPNGREVAEATVRGYVDRALAGGEEHFVWDQRHDGGVFHASAMLSRLEVDNGPVQLLATIRDETPMRRLHEQAAQAERMASIGTMAAGIAHELNTPIQYVGDSLHFLREVSEQVLPGVRRVAPSVVGAEPDSEGRLRLPGEFDELAGEVERSFLRCFEGLERVRGIVKAMLEYSRRDPHRYEWSDLRRCIGNLITISGNELASAGEVSVVLASLPPVYCNVSDVGQALMNLLVNASYAVKQRHGERGDGHIEVRGRVEGDQVVLEVEDDGVGIPETSRARVFEPFYTTRAVGQGTGQGLTIAWAIIVEQHKGQLEFDSEVGVGTTFRVRLPIGETLRT